LLRDPRTIFLVAFDGVEPVGFVLAYELLGHGYSVTLCINEVEVTAAHRRRGIGTRLLRQFERIARERGIEEALLTDEENAAGIRLYESTLRSGGRALLGRQDVHTRGDGVAAVTS
jgi:ribosomal protein S18 acetylase RimI-like enzyme